MTSHCQHLTHCYESHLVCWLQAAYSDIIDDFLNFLEVILEPVEAFPESVILEVQQTEAGVQLTHELGDTDGSAIVACSHNVHSQARLELIKSHRLTI